MVLDSLINPEPSDLPFRTDKTRICTHTQARSAFPSMPPILPVQLDFLTLGTREAPSCWVPVLGHKVGGLC